MLLEIADRVVRQAHAAKADNSQLLSSADIAAALSVLGLAAFDVFAGRSQAKCLM